MPAPQSKLFDLEDQVKQALAAHGPLSEVTGILTDRSEELQSRIDRTIAKFSGLLIAITLKSAQVKTPNAFASLQLDPVELALVIAENPTLNRSPTGTGVHGDLALMECAAALHGHKPAAAGRMIVVTRLGRAPASARGTAEWYATLQTSLHIPTAASLYE